MEELNLLHIAPIRFAREILCKEETKARVSLVYEQFPSLGMMIEGAAQASASFGDDSTQGGFLVSLKNVKLLEKPESIFLEIELLKEHDLGSMTYFNFVIFEETKELVKGSFVIAKS